MFGTSMLNSAARHVLNVFVAVLLMSGTVSAEPFNIAGPTGAVIDPVVGGLFTVDLVTGETGTITDLNISIEIACFREYGLALSMAGRHYSYLLQDVREELRTARRAESERLQHERDEYLDERIRYLQLSRRAYEGYFRHPATTAVTPKDLRRVMNDQEILGDYEAALLYLKLYKVSLGSEIPDVLQEAFKEHLVRYTHQARIARERREREREQRLLDVDLSPDRRWRPEDRN